MQPCKLIDVLKRNGLQNALRKVFQVEISVCVHGSTTIAASLVKFQIKIGI